MPLPGCRAAEDKNHDEEDHVYRSYRRDRRGPVATRRVRHDIRSAMPVSAQPPAARSATWCGRPARHGRRRRGWRHRRRERTPTDDMTRAACGGLRSGHDAALDASRPHAHPSGIRQAASGGTVCDTAPTPYNDFTRRRTLSMRFPFSSCRATPIQPASLAEPLERADARSRASRCPTGTARSATAGVSRSIARLRRAGRC